MKKNDRVLFTGEYDDLKGVPHYNREQILEDRRGIIYRVHATDCEVRTSLGIWYIDKNLLEVSNEH